MSKHNKMTVHLHGQKVVVSNVGDTIHIQRHFDTTGGRVDVPETLFSITPEEASYIAGAIRTVIGEATPLEPIERTVIAPESSESDAN